MSDASDFLPLVCLPTQVSVMCGQARRELRSRRACSFDVWHPSARKVHHEARGSSAHGAKPASHSRQKIKICQERCT
jgi:hypothetical protein